MAPTDASAVTQVLPANASGLEAALGYLRGQLPVVFPTDTVYGVGADLWQEQSVRALFRAKQRPLDMPIPVLVSSPEGVDRVASMLPPTFARLVDSFWPGGLTLIVPRRAAVPDVLCAGGDTVAVRMPNHPTALEIIAAMGGALAATSANLSGHPAPRSAQDAFAELANRVPLILDGGICPGGVASTIVDLASSPPILLRAGPIPQATLQELLPGLQAS